MVTITLNDNPKLIKIIKEIASAFGEPIKVKKEKYATIDYESPEMLAALQEAKELEAALLRGEIKGLKSMEEYDRAVNEI